MNMTIRTRFFSLVSYLDKDTINTILADHNRSIKCFAYIYHNKDTKIIDDVEKAIEPHFHILIYCYNALSLSTVLKWFTYNHTENTLIEKGNSIVELFLYLMHKNRNYDGSDGKYIYDYIDITTNNADFFTDTESVVDGQNIAYQIVCDILAGTSLKVMLLRYGRDFVIHYNQYTEFAFELSKEQNKGKLLELTEEDKQNLPF